MPFPMRCDTIRCVYIPLNNNTLLIRAPQNAANLRLSQSKFELKPNLAQNLEINCDHSLNTQQ
ncbi:uncharacterized protein Dmoj_GI27016 [Drosophila mojavensis]|uniref:Uncharacterized protein n=1 Tax=Drosophila mojavensis TaxID=7230 RepID=A0A0Q9XLW4_DROMO|nr:uncharacterized protein Dmoj_GI27016 [Drosophila mojavensis]